MGAKEYLQQIPKANAIIACKMAEIQRWEDIATSITAHTETVRIGGQEYGLEKVQTSHNTQDGMADAIAMCADAQMELLEAVKHYRGIIADVSKTIEQLPTVEYQVVHGIYVQQLTLWEIADDLDKSYSAVATAHSRAIQDLEEILAD